MATNGLIESYKDTDWSLDTITEIPQRGLHTRAVASQDVLDICACFFVAPFCAAVDCFAPAKIRELYPDFKTRVKLAMKEGWDNLAKDGKFTPGYGGYFVDGVDYARKVWNKYFPELQVSSFITPVGSDKFNLAVGLYWAPVIGIYANSSAYLDIIEDNDLDNVPTGCKYGHCVRYGKDIPNASRMEIIDNYPSKMGVNNEYGIDLLEYKANGGVMNMSYFFFPKK